MHSIFPLFWFKLVCFIPTLSISFQTAKGKVLSCLTVEFYHFTSEAGADAIITSGIIRMSRDGGPDAHFGQGRCRTFQIIIAIIAM
jgi:hypothetical protein